MTELHQRALKLDPKGVRQCLADGADVNAIDDNDDTVRQKHRPVRINLLPD